MVLAADKNIGFNGVTSEPADQRVVNTAPETIMTFISVVSWKQELNYLKTVGHSMKSLASLAGLEIEETAGHRETLLNLRYG